jgi:3-methyl-2-oxobutanoate hydroxymethyltransferase
MERKKVTIPKLHKMKRDGEKISMLTAYDTPTARMLDNAGIEIILVGDSVGNTTLGFQDTIPVTMDMMIHHTQAVMRGAKFAFVVGDMPFMSYQVSDKDAVRNAGRFIKEGGSHCVKLEGGKRVESRVASIVEAGIPVMGHLGLTPQSSVMLGGYRVQGKTAETLKILVEDAKCLEKAGAFAILLELVPGEVGKAMSEAVDVPVIGIGAGPHCDGQVLIYHDMVGVEAVFNPSFVKKYANLEEIITSAVKNYIGDVKGKKFPGPEHTFKMAEGEDKKI